MIEGSYTAKGDIVLYLTTCYVEWYCFTGGDQWVARGNPSHSLYFRLDQANSQLIGIWTFG